MVSPSAYLFFRYHGQLSESLGEEEAISLCTETDDFGEVRIVKERSGTNYIEGIFLNRCTWGDYTVPVHEVFFVLPNMQEFHGSNLKNRGLYRGRISLVTDDYTVIADKLQDYKIRKEELELAGGFHFLYSGKVNFGKGKNLKLVQEELQIINCFLSFINGRSVSALFLTGFHGDVPIWKDFSSYNNEPYQNCTSWAPVFFRESIFQEAFINMRKLWQNKSYRNFVETAIDWYLISNNSTKNIDSAMIMAQAALELIYNWLIIEKDGLLKGGDAVNISASNKIRLLLSKVGMSYDPPSGYEEMINYISSNQELEDAIGVIVNYRNSIVHSQKKKRDDLFNMPFILQWQCLQLSLKYIELSLLFIFGYNNQYQNRCECDIEYEFVPWKNNIKQNV